MIFLELFGIFFVIGACTFGGGYAMIPLIQDFVVNKFHWIEETTLTDFIAISESTPGPFAINISTFVGYQVAGPLGSICTTIAVVLPSLIVITIIAMVLTKFMNNKYVKGALKGVQPVVIALISSVTIVLFFKIIFFDNGVLLGDYKFDMASLSLLLMLLGIMFIYKKLYKKNLSPILILILSAVIGLIAFI